MVELFEVAVSRYTFIGDQLLEQQSQVALKAVNQEELAAMLASYQLTFVQSVLQQGKAVAIGSGNVLSETMTQQGGTRIFYGMVVFSLDGAAPTVQSIPYIVDTFYLELRESFSRSPRPAAAYHAPTPNLSGLRGHTPRFAQGAL
jgi:DNA-binding transcriptional regulator LsrR (DeoR family)